MEKIASARLIERALQVSGPSSLGLSAEDIARVAVDDALIADIEECLSSEDVSELKWGLWFAYGILSPEISSSFLKHLLPRVPIWLTHRDDDVRDRSQLIYIRLRNNYNNYSSTMQKLLNDPAASVRRQALDAYETFLKIENIPALFPLEKDMFASETSMYSPLSFIIRNQALKTIELLGGTVFQKIEGVEIVEGDPVYFWEWAPMYEWWNKRNSRWVFWKKNS
ncbi:MAG TPA: hypothetical protein VMF06_01195 [Candidatus Limnocylindria bacterium]|jgi:hypothetical protein|nr:hypothetical protein [Candidatus Limnocylindria bacterium]